MSVMCFLKWVKLVLRSILFNKWNQFFKPVKYSIVFQLSECNVFSEMSEIYLLKMSVMCFLKLWNLFLERVKFVFLTDIFLNEWNQFFWCGEIC